MNRELLMLVDALSMEKNVEKNIVFSALELALFSNKKENEGRNGCSSIY